MQRNQEAAERMELSSINFWAILAGTVFSFILGLIWYGPLFGAAWRNHTGLDKTGQFGQPGLLFGPAFILIFTIGLVIAALLPSGASWLDGLLLGTVLSLGVAIAGIGLSYLRARRSMALFLIDAGYLLLVFMLLGVIIGVWHA